MILELVDDDSGVGAVIWTSLHLCTKKFGVAVAILNAEILLSRHKLYGIFETHASRQVGTSTLSGFETNVFQLISLGRSYRVIKYFIARGFYADTNCFC